MDNPLTSGPLPLRVILGSGALLLIVGLVLNLVEWSCGAVPLGWWSLALPIAGLLNVAALLLDSSLRRTRWSFVILAMVLSVAGMVGVVSYGQRRAKQGLRHVPSAQTGFVTPRMP
jgi:membrane protein implicated in regulation of membrane protease activity